MENRIATLAGGGIHSSAKMLAEHLGNNIYDVKPLTNISNPTLKLISILLKSFYYCYKIPKYDIYFIVSTPGLFLGFLKKKLRGENCKLILRVNNRLFSHTSIFKKFFLKPLFKSLDVLIAVSEMIKNEIIKENNELPVFVVNTPLKDSSFFYITPDFDNKNIICLGTAERLRKGTDIQIKVQKNLNNCKMYILGNKTSIKNIYKNNRNLKNLIFTGYVNPQKYLQKSLFLLHPARFDAGPNAVVEAMAAGLIPIISNRTGHQKLVKKVDESLIIDSLNYLDYLRKLESLRNKSDIELKHLSRSCKLCAKDYQNKNNIDTFRENFWSLVSK